MKNYYHILGLNRTASRREIRRATYKLGKQLHQHKSKLKERDNDRFIDVIEAYTVLYDDDTREEYHWLFDLESGKKQLREHALPFHRKTYERSSQYGIWCGENYAKQPFKTFRHDMKPLSGFGWLNIFSSIPI